MNEVPFTYSIRTYPARIEGSPVSIGDRLIRTLDALSESDPMVFANWEITDRPTTTSMPLAMARSRIGTVVEDNVVRDQLGKPDPDSGYDVWAFTAVDDRSRMILLWVKAGGRDDGHVWLQTSAPNLPVDLSIVTFPAFKAALLALAENWALPWIAAYAFRSNYDMVPVHGGAGFKLESRPMLPQAPAFPRSPFEIPWIGYPSANLSAGLKLSPEIVTERVLDGGLLMIATEDRLDPTIPNTCGARASSPKR